MRCLVLLSLVSLALAGCRFRGVNQAGAEFTDSKIPGIPGTDYAWPTPSSIDWFISNGANVFRIPFLWERAQTTLGHFDYDYMTNLDKVVNHTTAAGAYAMIDPHNYFKYRGQAIGSSVSYDDFNAFWEGLAQRYKSNNKVIFNLMNEPNSVPTETVLTAMQGAINSIRHTGAKNLILAPGNAWTGGHSWFENWYGTSNADTMGKLSDPANNFAFDIHQYLDSDYSGQDSICISNFDANNILGPLTNWLKQKGLKAFLGEFGFANNANCYNAGKNLLNHLESNSDVWLGWTYWSAGPFWGNYIYSVEPTNGAAGQWTNILGPFMTEGHDQPTPTTKVPTSTKTHKKTKTKTTKPKKTKVTHHRPLSSQPSPQASARA